MGSCRPLLHASRVVPLVLLVLSRAVWAAPPAVDRSLVFNSTLKGDNGYNANCQGWSWQEAGFLQATGEPRPRDGAGNILDDNGQIIGTLNLGGGGWLNTAKRIEIADLTKTSLQAVYNLFEANQTGVLHISTHGGFRTKAGKTINGGAILVDDNKPYAGFGDPNANPVGAGTNFPDLKPYVLAQGPLNGQIQLELYNCFSGADPDGKGPILSVARSAFGPNAATDYRVPGVSAVLSSAKETQALAQPVITNPPFLPGVMAGHLKTHMAANRKKFNGKVTPTDWTTDLKFEDHFQKLNADLGLTFPVTVVVKVPKIFIVGRPPRQVVQMVPVPTVVPVTLAWTISYSQTVTLRSVSPADLPFAKDFPVVFTPADGAVVSYETPDGDGFGATFTIDDVQAGNLELGGAMLHLGAFSDLEIIPPASDLDLVTGVFHLAPMGGPVQGVIGSATLQFDRTIHDPGALALYLLDGGAWIPLSGGSMDPAAGTISAPFTVTNRTLTDSDGIVIAGFAPINTPVPFGGEDSGFLPPSTTVRKCEGGLAAQMGRLMKKIVKCHRDLAKGVLDAAAEEACEAAATDQFDRVARRRPNCPACAIGNIPNVITAAEALFDANNELIFCAGSTPFGDDDTGFVPPDPDSAACEDKVANATSTLLIHLVKCHRDRGKGTLADEAAEEACEATAAAAFDAKTAKLEGCPSCATDNFELIREVVEFTLDDNNGLVYCASPSGAFLEGSGSVLD